MSPQRKKVVALCAGVACMAGGPVLLKGHPILIWAWIAVMVALLIVAIQMFAKLKRQGL
jgi:hypothetical protein